MPLLFLCIETPRKDVLDLNLTLCCHISFPHIMGVEINVGTTWPIFNTITSLCACVFHQQLMVVCLLLQGATWRSECPPIWFLDLCCYFSTSQI